MGKLGRGRVRTASHLRWRLAAVFVALTVASVASGNFDWTATAVSAVVLLGLYAIVVRWMADR